MSFGEVTPVGLHTLRCGQRMGACADDGIEASWYFGGAFGILVLDASALLLLQICLRRLFRVLLWSTLSWPGVCCQCELWFCGCVARWPLGLGVWDVLGGPLQRGVRRSTRGCRGDR